MLEPLRLRIWASIVTFFKRKSQKEAWLNPITNVISITLYDDPKDARTADYLRWRMLEDDPRYRPIQKLSLTQTYKAGVFIFWAALECSVRRTLYKGQYENQATSKDTKSYECLWSVLCSCSSVNYW